MRILVTGGAGFIGSHVTDAFIAAGHEVAVIDDLSTGSRANLNPVAQFFQADIRAPGIEDIVTTLQPEVLCHHAAQLDLRRSVDDPCFDAEINLIGFLRVIESARKQGLKKVLFASSGGAIYGEQENFPATEKHATKPLSPYGIAKLATEHYLEFYRSTYGLPYIALRYSNVYGPRQNADGEAGVVAVFSDALLRDAPARIFGDGEQTRDYVFVGDIVSANEKALASDYCGPLNLGTGVETSVNQLYQELCRLVGVAPQAGSVTAPLGEQRRSCLDFSRARSILGWQPEHELGAGLKETVEYFQAKGH